MFKHIKEKIRDMSKEYQRHRVGIKITREKRWITYKVTQLNRE